MARATLNGQLVDDGGEVCHVHFQWGTSIDYGQETPVQYGFTTGMTFDATITGLGEGILHHFRAVAENILGISYGQDIAFATLLSPGIDVIIDDAALAIMLRG